MRKYVWLLILAIPPWVAVKLDAPKWGVVLAVAPFFILAMTLDDPDEDLLGESSGAFRKGALIAIGVGGLVLGGVLLILWQVFFSGS
ncbi:hypothetical protein V1318_02435 [Lysobacter sp. CCNWLW3]|uniref:hypothetical protein n=1 Tax=unclassified Lysobacter TaxID=2635362 RepID=UPI002FD70B13